ncbi:MAG: TetR/AcrR family transcriptional regulator [Methylomonas sp.]
MNTLSIAKRQTILNAARQAFLAHGYSGASMEAIAEAAPVSKPTLYSYFKNKQELFAAVIAERCELLLSAFSHIKTRQLEPASALKSIVGAFADMIYAPEALGLYRLIVAEHQQFPELGELVYHSGPELILQQLAAYLTELHVAKTLNIPDVDMSSRLLLGMLKGDEHFRCLLGLRTALSAQEKERLIHAAVHLFLKGHGYER